MKFTKAIPRPLAHMLAAFFAFSLSSPGAASLQEDKAGQHVARLIEQLKTMDTHRQAAEDLRKVAVDDLVPALTRAIRSDTEFGAVDWLRGAAYAILLEVGSESEHGELRYGSTDQVAQILEGLSDPDVSIRGICLKATPRIDEAYAPEVVPRVIPMLNEEDPRMVSTAADVLAQMGSQAKSAMAALYDLLLAEKREERARWERVRAAQTKDGKRQDMEIKVRSMAAHARMRINGVHTDLGVYSRLDWRGQAAAISALRHPVLLAVTRSKPQVPIPMEDLRRIMAFLAGSLVHREIPVDSQLTALGLIAWIAGCPETDKALRKKGVEHLRAMDAHSSEQVRMSALRWLERMGN